MAAFIVLLLSTAFIPWMPLHAAPPSAVDFLQQATSQSTSVKSVKYSLLLSNNTDVTGNDPQTGVSLSSMVFDPQNGLIYVTDTFSDRVLIFNPATDSFTGSVWVGSFPLSMAYDSANGMVYVSNPYSRNLSVISTASNTLAGTIPLNVSVNFITYDSGNSCLYLKEVYNQTLLQFNTTTKSVVSNITLSQNDIAIFFDYSVSNNLIYGAGALGNFYKINPTNGSVISAWDGIGDTVNVYCDPFNGTVFVLYNIGNSIGAINETTNTWVSRMSSPSQPIYSFFQSMAALPGSDDIYVANSETDSVMEYNVTTGSLTGNIPVGATPYWIVYDTVNGMLYVSNSQSNSISEIDPHTDRVVSTVPLLPAPGAVAYDQANSMVYVTDLSANSLLAIDSTTDRVVSSVAVGDCPEGVAVDSATGNVYVANTGSNSVSVVNISANRVDATIPVGWNPQDIAFDTHNGLIYVTNSNSNNVSIINPASQQVAGSVNVGHMPWGVAYDPLNQLVYVADFYSDSISEINGTTQSVVYSMTQVPDPSGIAFDPFNGYLVALSYGNPGFDITVMTGNNQLVGLMVLLDTMGNIVGNGGGTIVYDPADNNLYSTIPETGQLQAISSQLNTNLPVGKLSVGYYPSGIAFDALNNYLYVANTYSGTVSIISTGTFYNTTFSETGLPRGAKWTVLMEHGVFTTNASSLSFLLMNGSYNYSVSASDTAWGTPNPVGTVEVKGSAAAEAFVFSTTYIVTVIARGLPSQSGQAYIWMLTVNGQQFYVAGPGTSFPEPNGTYSYSVYHLVNYSKQYIASGEFYVSGAATTVYVDVTSTQVLLDELITYLLPSAIAVAAGVAGFFIYRRLREGKEHN